MKRYTVQVPIVAVCYVNVEAENEEEAIDNALNSEDLSLENIEEWDAYRIIAEGNCLHTFYNQAEVVSEEDVAESGENRMTPKDYKIQKTYAATKNHEFSTDRNKNK